MNYSLSAALYEESQRYLAGGVASSLRGSMKPVPIFAQSASGARIRDVDGNEYIDYLLGYGPLILGHAHPALTEQIHQAMTGGFTYGVQHGGELELARLLTETLPCAERVCFSGSGTEAVMLSLRLARAYTGRAKAVRFHGHYHGWSDAIFTSFPTPDMSQSATSAAADTVPPGTEGQSAASLEDIILLPWNDPERLEATLRASSHEIAAVITEPVMCNSGCIEPLPGFLENLRCWTAELGIVLIFDEVITGFRLGPGGAHGKFGIKPDLVTIGKAMGGGIAISAVAGKADIMRLVESGRVSHLGTLNGNCIQTAAATATIRELAKDGGAAFKRMESIAAMIAEGIRKLLDKSGIPGLINQPGPLFNMMFTEQREITGFHQYQQRDAARYARFAELMLDEGVLIRPNGLWYVSAAHGEEEAAYTLQAAERALMRL